MNHALTSRENAVDLTIGIGAGDAIQEHKSGKTPPYQRQLEQIGSKFEEDYCP